MEVADILFSTVGFSEAEDRALQALVTLSERALVGAWRHVEDFGMAKVVVVCLDSADGGAFWKSQPRHYPSKCFVACSTRADVEAAWRLGLPPGHLPSRREMIDLLNRLSRSLADAEDSAGACVDLQAGPAGGRADEAAPLAFDPAWHFLGLLQAAVAAGDDSLFILPGRAWLVAFPHNQHYYSAMSVDELGPLLSSPPEAVQARRLQADKVLRSHWVKELAPRPLAELLWHAVLAVSAGRLWVGCGGEDVVRLRQWPPVAHLPSYRKFLRVAAFMGRNAASLRSVAEHTSAPLGDVFDFHNACVAMGVLDRPGRAELAQKAAAAPERELYRKISSRLARVGEGGGGRP